MKNRTSIIIASLLALAQQGCSHAIAPGAGPDPGVAAATAPETAKAGGAPARAVDVYRVPVGGLPSIGNPDALVTIVEFTDYECPYCQRAEQTMARLRTTYGDSVRIVVAELPLPFHDRARPAALAALAADAQGKFEAMHTRLFALGGSLAEGPIAGAAQESGLDLARFGVDRNAAPLGPSEQLAEHLGVKGTPTFFIGGRRIVGAQPYETFRDVVEERLAAAHALVTSGMRPRDVYAALIATGADHVTSDDADGKHDGPGCGGKEGKECKGGPDDSPPADTIESVPIDGAPARGSSRASTTIVAFSDFECPYCAKAEATLRAIEEAHPGDVRVVFKSRPLPMHSHARLAAVAAMAADEQGRFWDFHDRLFARSGASMDRVGLVKIATDLGLDAARFARDLDDPKLAARVARDEADGDALSVKGTPTFFVNGRRVVGAQPASVFEATLAKR